jgi:hypothetical protein
LGFESISVGNRDFMLFEKANPNDICGAAINSAEVSEIDTANFRTLRTMLKKTRAIQVWRLNKTWPILKVMVESPEEFRNIRGLTIEFDFTYAELIMRVLEVFADQLTEFYLSETTYQERHEQAYMSLVKAILCRSSA